MWEPRRLTTLWNSTACYRNSFTFLPFLLQVVRNICVHSGTILLLREELVSRLTASLALSRPCGKVTETWRLHQLRKYSTLHAVNRLRFHSRSHFKKPPKPFQFLLMENNDQVREHSEEITWILTYLYQLLWVEFSVMNHEHEDTDQKQ
jgi:hypothetical protein